MTEKRCSKCNTLKQLDAFCRKKTGKYGVSSICKECDAKRASQYEKQNRQKASISDKAYYEKNKKRIGRPM